MEKKFSFDQVDILLIDPDRQVRAMIRNILTDNGFRKVTMGSSMHDIEEKFRMGMPDLLISDLKLADGDLNAFVYGLRHHEVGYNPFLPIIITAWSPTTDDVRAIVQCGADDMISKPLSAQQILQRIQSLIVSRKPFVVTSGYIGPDRRKPGPDHDRGMKINPIVVPNTLREKALGEHPDANSIQAEIDACIKRVNLEKLDRHAHQVTWLVDRIVPSLYEGGESDMQTRQHLKRLLYVSEDISRRMIGTKFEHVGELCRSLTDVTTRIIRDIASPSSKDIGLLKPLAQSIQRGFNESDEGASRYAHEISSTVSTKPAH